MYFQSKSPSLVAICLLAIVTLFASCKPTVEGQTEDWKANMEHVNAMITDMPGFATALGSVKTKAEAAWAEAEKNTDEDKKAEAMKAANEIISKGFAGHLFEMDGLMTEIDDYRSKLAGKTMSSSLIARINDAVDPANEAVDKANSVMAAGAPDEASAEALVTPAYDALKASRDKWKSLKDAYDKEQRDRKKKK